MEYKIFFAVLGAILAIYASFGYLRDVVQNKIKPHPYTWLIWSIVSGVIFFSQVVKGAGWGMVPTFFAEVFTILIFLASIRHGFKNIRKIDHLFLLIAILGLIPWYIYKDPTISVIVVVIIDLIAFMPTVFKTWTKPKSENPYFFEINIGRHICGLLALQSYSIATALHSSVMIFANAVIPFEVYYKKYIKKIKK